MLLERPPHPDPVMEARFKEAEADGFTITAREHPNPERGFYFYLRDGCDPPHVGTVQQDEVYVIVIERALRRCPVWREKHKKRKEAR